MQNKTIYTIGHSTRSIEEFLELLEAFKISLLADVRSVPGSSRYPHFNKEFLVKFLAGYHIDYLHIKELGGQRKVSPSSKNTGWRSKAFRGYADFMENDELKTGISILLNGAEKKNTAYMCAESVWWRCHRALISDYLKLHGWSVLHIIDKNNVEEHPYTQPARIVQGGLFYNEDEESAPSS
jgi:uncharacterized protein (DUF488 family)